MRVSQTPETDMVVVRSGWIRGIFEVRVHKLSWKIGCGVRGSES